MDEERTELTRRHEPDLGVALAAPPSKPHGLVDRLSQDLNWSDADGA
ncbi:hypothetical protein [Streptomyces sp. NPDC002994]